MSIPPDLYGPFGLLIALVLASAALWREHLRADEDDRDQRDAAMAGWKAQTDANGVMAAAFEKRVKAEAERRRRSDP